MKNIQEVLSFSTQYLQNAGVVNARYSAESIIAFILKCKRLDLYLNFDRPLIPSELDGIKNCLMRRKVKEPLEYIFNFCEFYNCNLKITKDVLIPRPETEQLVDMVSKVIKNDLKENRMTGDKNFSGNIGETIENKNLWDICTGSGCIAVALKKSVPGLNVHASDISAEALDVAKSNALQNGCFIDFREGDLLDPFKNEKADYIICNPPYVSEDEYGGLMDDVRKFEPKRALVAADDGMWFYKKFAGILPQVLNPGGKVFFEIGYSQGSLVKDIFIDERWVSRKVYKDLSGKDRFFFLEIE